MKNFLVASFMVLALPSIIIAQTEIRLSAGINYSTASRILPFANISDFDLREKEISLGSFLAPHIGLGLGLTNNLTAVISLEYSSKKSEYYGQTVEGENGTIYIPVKDGYTFIPLEVSLEYKLPFSSDDWRFYIGGGGGLYFFSSRREVAGIPLSEGGTKTSYGIHVLTSMEYYFRSDACIFFTMKFRDPEVEFKGEYSSLTGNYEGKTVRLGNKSFYQKLTLEGTSFLMGVEVAF